MTTPTSRPPGGYHKLDTIVDTTIEATTEATQRAVEAAARLAGVSTYAVESHMRRMALLSNEMKTHASGFVGISLGRVELPGMDRGLVRSDGWRAATIGPDSIVPALPTGQVHVTDGSAGEAIERAAMTQEEIDRDVATLQQFMLDVEAAEGVAEGVNPTTTQDASRAEDLPRCDVDPMSGLS